jgi:hypothetical protein
MEVDIECIMKFNNYKDLLNNYINYLKVSLVKYNYKHLLYITDKVVDKKHKYEHQEYYQ